MMRVEFEILRTGASLVPVMFTVITWLVPSAVITVSVSV